VRADEHLASIPILMLTARVEDTDKILGLELGADDYLTKPFNPREVVARVRAILRRAGGTLKASRILESGVLRLDPDRHTVRVSDEMVEMTPTEFEVLRVLMENPDHAFTRGELVEQALGYEYEGMERTLDSHIKNLRKKIGSDYIETVFGVGYRFRETEVQA
jgi:two-component system alkaline phosphatase synthesis response regulator PhoP